MPAHSGTVRDRLRSQAPGFKVAERGGKNGKATIVATARKLAVLLHHMWSGEVHERLHNGSRMTAVPAA